MRNEKQGVQIGKLSPLFLIGALIIATPATTGQGLPPPAPPLSAEIQTLLKRSETVEEADLEQARALIAQARGLVRTETERALVDEREFLFIMDRGDYETGLTLGTAALERARQTEDIRATFDWLVHLGRVRRLVGDAVGGLRSLNEAIELAQELPDIDSELARAHDLAAANYRGQAKTEQAAFHYELASQYTERSGDEAAKAAVLSNYGLVLMDLKRFEEAQAAHQNALDYYRTHGFRMREATAAFNLAVLEMVQGNFEASIPAMKAAEEIYTELDSKGRLSNVQLTLAEVYLNIGDIKASARYLEAAKPLITFTSNLTRDVKYHRLLALVLAAKGNTREAVETSYNYIKLRNQLAGDRVKRDIAWLESERELARRQAALAEAARDEARSQAELDRIAGKLVRTRTLYFSITAIALSLGIAAVFILQARSRSERRILRETSEARKVAESANDLKSRLLAIASHDLKSPLRNVEIVATEIDTRTTDPETSAAVKTIRRQSGRMFNLIRELIDMSALETGRMELDLQPVNPSGHLIAARDRHLAVAATKDVSIDLHIEPSELDHQVDIDPDRFDQVLDNLIDNAIKFSPRGQRVLLELSAQDTWLKIAVTDHGPGFSPEDYLHIFQPFQTLSAEATGGESSSGLGLHIAHEIVGLHGGRLGIDSVPGQGATLVIELPMETAAEVGELAGQPSP